MHVKGWLKVFIIGIKWELVIHPELAKLLAFGQSRNVHQVKRFCGNVSHSRGQTNYSHCRDTCCCDVLQKSLGFGWAGKLSSSHTRTGLSTLL